MINVLKNNVPGSFTVLLQIVTKWRNVVVLVHPWSNFSVNHYVKYLTAFLGMVNSCHVEYFSLLVNYVPV